MAIEFNPGNVGKVNSLIRNNPQLNVTDNTQANYVTNFKKADANGDGKLTADEFKRYAKDVLPSSMDLSMFGGADTQVADFDQALGEWFDSVSGGGDVASAAAVGEKTSSLPALDAGKTWAKGAANKIARGEELNFGHKPVDGELWKMQDGSPVWADKGTQVTREQLAAMPDYQVKKFYQMMGLGYDPKVDFPDAAERKKLADRVTIPDPVSPAITDAMKAALKDLEQIKGAIASRESDLKGRLDGADPGTTQQIRAQLAQLGTLSGHLQTMHQDLSGVQFPGGLDAAAEGRVMAAISQIHNGVKGLAGAAASDQGPLMAQFTLAMNQLLEPERDMKTDALAQNQYNTLVDASRVMGALSDRMDSLSRQRSGSDSKTQAQIDAQMAQLMNVFQGFSQVATPLFDYRADLGLSEQDRKQKADLINQLHGQIKQMGGMDSAQFQRMVQDAQRQLQGL